MYLIRKEEMQNRETNIKSIDLMLVSPNYYLCITIL
jgi:hypothetical protein